MGWGQGVEKWRTREWGMRGWCVGDKGMLWHSGNRAIVGRGQWSVVSGQYTSVNTQGAPWAAQGILTAIKYLMPRGF